MFRLSTLLLLCCLSAHAQTDTWRHNRSVTHDEAIAAYAKLAQARPDRARLLTYGLTDIGRPLHLFVCSADGVFDPDAIHQQGRVIVMVMNGIHPGEPEGVDASLRLAEDLVAGRVAMPKQAVLCIIPVYNIGGALKRSPYNRPNQNGPEEMGFRGNARHLDLNRDFVKADSRNAQSFIQLFQVWKPDVFIDTHTTNGADYQHTMTLITSEQDKMTPPLGEYVSTRFEPELYRRMAAQGYDMCPYVTTRGATPETGIVDFLETPRYSTGYAALFHTVGFVTETLKFKPFPARVEQTYALIRHIYEWSAEEAAGLRAARRKADDYVQKQRVFPLDWALDTTRHDSFRFMGYEAGTSKGAFTGAEHVAYDTTRPWTKDIPYYNRYTATMTATKPYAYVVPQAWPEVVERLRWSGSTLLRLTQDTTLDVEAYYIEDYKTLPTPYEGHYAHSHVKVRTERQQLRYHVGDYIVRPEGPATRFIVETLEPEAVDAFFVWNFFDEILMQKEWFSGPWFEETARQLVEADPALRRDFEARLAADPDFDVNAQLLFIFRRSPYYEKAHNRYPVTRLTTPVTLPLAP